MRERTNYQIRSDLNVESGDMNLWDDARIVEEAAMAACELYGHAMSGLKMDYKKSRTLAAALASLIGWCLANKDLIHFRRKEDK